jgi:cytochrome oxidase Cu insertion factor (SCO1/SenC/PrrC family)
MGFYALVAGVPIVLVVALISAFTILPGTRTESRASSDAKRLSQARNNPNVDPGTSLPGAAAPGFTLTDQFGMKVSLSQFRGKIVVLAFVDSRCTTVCPLTTVSMTEAVSMLGPAAARHVQLLGIDANPDATAVADVRAYSLAHQMMHSWHFLTGTPSELARVWRAYHVFVAASHGNIDHEPAMYVIDSAGRERTLYLTQMAYAGVGQQADLIADGLAQVLPGHPKPHQVVPLSVSRPIGPGTAASLPVIGGADQAGSVTIGPGHPQVVVFIASWISEISDLPAELRVLASYQQQAQKHGWPSVVAVDETQTETSTTTLPALLRQAGGARLGYPVVADTSGQVADGYAVQDIPWIVITSSAGHILYRHDGWLSAAALAHAVTAVAAHS